MAIKSENRSYTIKYDIWPELTDLYRDTLIYDILFYINIIFFAFNTKLKKKNLSQLFSTTSIAALLATTNSRGRGNVGRVDESDMCRVRLAYALRQVAQRTGYRSHAWQSNATDRQERAAPQKRTRIGELHLHCSKRSRCHQHHHLRQSSLWVLYLIYKIVFCMQLDPISFQF